MCSFRPKLVIYSVLTLVFVFPLLTLLILPFLIFRTLILELGLKKLLRPDLSQMLSPTSAVFASDGVYKNPKCIILVTWVVQGKLSIEKFRKNFNSALYLPQKNNNTTENNYIFPELKQYLTQWLGYTFWKNDPNFMIENHISDLKFKNFGALKNVQSLLPAVELLLKKPFPEFKSPWEFLICGDVDRDSEGEFKCANENISLIFFRMHHALGDGISLNRILSKILPQQSFKLEEILDTVKGGRPQPFKWLIKSPLKMLSFPCLAVFETLESFADGADRNDWHNYKVNNTASALKWFSINRVSLQSLRRTRDFLNNCESVNGIQIQRKLPLSTFSLILTGITVGIRDAMLGNGCEVPSVLHSAVPLPLPGHPETLSNHMTTCIIPLPTGLEDVESISRFIQLEISRIKGSTLPWMGALPPNILGRFPQSLIKPFSRWNLTTGIVSNFPGPKVQTQILGCPVLDLSAFVSLPADISFMAVCFGYNSRLAINIGFNEALFPFQPTASPELFIEKSFQNIQTRISK